MELITKAEHDSVSVDQVLEFMAFIWRLLMAFHRSVPIKCFISLLFLMCMNPMSLSIFYPDNDCVYDDCVSTMIVVLQWLCVNNDCVFTMNVCQRWLCVYDCVSTMIVCLHDCVSTMIVCLPWSCLCNDCVLLHRTSMSTSPNKHQLSVTSNNCAPKSHYR